MGTPIVSSPKGSSQLDSDYRGILVTGGDVGTATTIFNPTAQSPRLNRGNVRVMNFDSVSRYCGLLWGGTDVWNIILKSVPPLSGLVTVANNLPIRLPAGPIKIYGSLGSVLVAYVEFWEED